MTSQKDNRTNNYIEEEKRLKEVAPLGSEWVSSVVLESMESVVAQAIGIFMSAVSRMSSHFQRLSRVSI